MVAKFRALATPKRIVIALVVANEIRGLIVVSLILVGWFHR